MRLERHVIRVTLVLIFATTLIASAAAPNLKEIMQGLRDDSVEIADGLLIGDLDRVAEGATRIANHAQIPPEQVQLVAAELGPEMPTFKQFDTLVHESSLSIAAAAEEGNHDQAIADYQRMLTGCFACHAAYRDRVAEVLTGATKTE